MSNQWQVRCHRVIVGDSLTLSVRNCDRMNSCQVYRGSSMMGLLSFCPDRPLKISSPTAKSMFVMFCPGSSLISLARIAVG